MLKPVFYSVCLLLCAFSSLNAQQNLVPNGGFENLYNCPIGADLYNAIDWFSPSLGTPDVYNSCASLSSNISTPINGYGFQNPKDGNGYAGFVPYSFNATSINYREYLGVKLKEKLIKSTLYKVGFYVSLANNSPIAINNIGFSLFNDSTFFSTAGVINLNEAHSDLIIQKDTSDWALIESYYVSKGNENYLYIGNFKYDLQTDTFHINTSLSEVYYYIDEVSVTKIDLKTENVFTPNGDGINDIAFVNSELYDFRVNIINRWGNIVRTSDFKTGWDGNLTSGKMADDGVYFYSIYSEFDTTLVVKTGFIHLIR